MLGDDRTRARRVIIAVPAAEGIGHAARIMQRLRDLAIETHLIVGEAARVDLEPEPDQIRSAEDLADHLYQPSNLAAKLSSGSFPIDGMIIVPCTAPVSGMIAHGAGDDLIHRAADVTIKEGRPLALLVLDARPSPVARHDLRKLAGIRGVSVVRGSDEGAGTPERDIDRVLRAAGIDREG